MKLIMSYLKSLRTKLRCKVYINLEAVKDNEMWLL